MRSTFLLAFIIAAGGVIAPLGGQIRYEPNPRNPSGLELVAIYVSATWCVGNRAERLHEAVEEAKLIFRDRAAGQGTGFRAVGVALDWHPDSGKVYLDEFGAWDEIAVGSNWFGMGPEILIWADNSAQAKIPQLIVYQHSVTPAGRAVAFGSRRILQRIYGGDAIVDWVGRGAPIDDP